MFEHAVRAKPGLFEMASKLFVCCTLCTFRSYRVSVNTVIVTRCIQTCRPCRRIVQPVVHCISGAKYEPTIQIQSVAGVECVELYLNVLCGPHARS